MLEVNVTLGQT